MGRRWDDVKRARLEHGQTDNDDAYQAGYEGARRAFELGAQVRRLREKRGMSQEGLAAEAGTSQPAIARLEAGGVEPKIDTLERIGRALGANLVVRFETPREAGTQSRP